jgi:hypothetical protein
LIKGTVIIFQVQGLENIRGGGGQICFYIGIVGSIFKTTQLAVNLSLKHLVVKKK